MIRYLCRRLRDWARGFTDEDIRKLQYRLKLLELQPPGEMIWLTRAETMALSRGRVIGVWTISVLSVKLVDSTGAITASASTKPACRAAMLTVAARVPGWSGGTAAGAR